MTKSKARISDDDLRAIVRLAVAEVDRGGPGSTTGPATALRFALSTRGLAAGCHVGNRNMTPMETVEWYAGQFLEIVDSRAWYAMNSWVNCADKFCPAPTPTVTAQTCSACGEEYEPGAGFGRTHWCKP